MIPDSLFKKLPHFSCGFKFFSAGTILHKGYKPDYVLRNGNKYILLESENNTNRKMFIGCVMKAAFFLQGEKSGELVIVLHEHSNTTVEQIYEHIKPYFYWIKDNGITNLERIVIISDNDYMIGVDSCLPLDSDELLIKAKVIF